MSKEIDNGTSSEEQTNMDKTSVEPIKSDDFSEKTSAELVEIINNQRAKISEVNQESKARRLKLEKFEAAEKEQKEKDLAAQELVKIRDEEIKQLKNTMIQSDLKNKATVKLIDKGFKPDLIEVGLPKDLTEDNLDKSIKEFSTKFKEYAETKSDKESPKPVNPFLSVQPSTPVTSNKKVRASAADAWDEMRKNAKR